MSKFLKQLFVAVGAGVASAGLMLAGHWDGLRVGRSELQQYLPVLLTPSSTGSQDPHEALAALQATKARLKEEKAEAAADAALSQKEATAWNQVLATPGNVFVVLSADLEEEPLELRREEASYHQAAAAMSLATAQLRGTLLGEELAELRVEEKKAQRKVLLSDTADLGSQLMKLKGAVPTPLVSHKTTASND